VDYDGSIGANLFQRPSQSQHCGGNRRALHIARLQNDSIQPNHASYTVPSPSLDHLAYRTYGKAWQPYALQWRSMAPNTESTECLLATSSWHANSDSVADSRIGVPGCWILGALQCIRLIWMQRQSMQPRLSKPKVMCWSNRRRVFIPPCGNLTLTFVVLL
jgi:hypothetical protein